MQHSESLTSIAPALVKALGKMEGIRKDAANPFFKSHYATLDGVTEYARPILAAEGLAVLQGPGEITNGNIALTTRLLHESGEWIESTVELPLAKADPQQAGSAITYARRYGLMAMLGVPAVDDDAESAMARTQPAAPKPITPAPEGKDWWGCKENGPSAHQAKKDGLGEVHEKLRYEIEVLTSGRDWTAWCKEKSPEIAKMPKSWRIELRNDAEEKARELGVDLNERRG